MSEITYQQKELKGLGGWLVLFQIQMWSILAGAVQNLVLFPIAGVFLENLKFPSYFASFGRGFFSVYDIYDSPWIYIFFGVITVLLVLCVVFFYKKKLVFRTFFIAESVVNTVSMFSIVFYLVNGLGSMYGLIAGDSTSMTNVFAVFYFATVIIPVIGINIAFIIALFKSKRVKNTFS